MSIQCSIPVCSINTGYKNHANKKRNEKNLLQPTETTLKQKEAAKRKTRQGCFGQRAKWMKWKWNEMRVWVTDGLTMNLEGRKVSQSVIHSFGVRVSELVSGRAGKWVGLSLLNKLSPPQWVAWVVVWLQGVAPLLHEAKRGGVLKTERGTWPAGESFILDSKEAAVESGADSDSDSESASEAAAVAAKSDRTPE